MAAVNTPSHSACCSPTAPAVPAAAADDDKCDTLFCRSGLRDTASRSFAELPVYRAFKAFLQVRREWGRQLQVVVVCIGAHAGVADAGFQKGVS